MVFVPLSLMVGPRAGHPEDLAGKDWLPGSSPAMKETGSLRIIHVLRAPVGGLFRHVGDLARAQAEAGHEVGLMCDTAPALEPGHLLIGRCQLGIHPIPMARLPGPGDLATARRIALDAARLEPDIIHGHGAKGGLHARLAGRLLGRPAVYTPHGGSLHYGSTSPQGMIYVAAERLLRRATAGLLFVCAYERDVYAERIGLGGCPSQIVHNGLWPEEFSPAVPDRDAADLLFIGELRWLKGLDVLIEAIALAAPGRALRAAIVGSGPDEQRFRQLAHRRGVDRLVTFHGPLPARQALRRGVLLVLPSRAESFPYVMLEAMAAGRPIIASRTGGIPELVPESNLVPPGDAAALLAAIEAARADPAAAAARAEDVARHMAARFAASRMAAAVTGFYAAVLDRRSSHARAVPE
jgi:glycosyltransferase involved in cell wall biosynthesis